MLAYPNKRWHLNNHPGNRLKARVLAGDTAVVEHDLGVPKAGLRECEGGTCIMMVVSPIIRGKSDSSRLSSWVSQKDLAHRVCWEFILVHILSRDSQLCNSTETKSCGNKIL